MSKFSDFVTEKKLDLRRLVLASNTVESYTKEDLELLKQKAAIKAGKAEKNEEIQKKKPRSGRPVTAATLNKAAAGRPLTGSAKTRIVRAVNALLATKKQAEVTIRELF